MLLYRISNDLSLVQISVATKPYKKFISGLLDADYFAMSLLGVSNGGAVTLNTLKQSQLRIVNNWFDTDNRAKLIVIKQFIRKNNGYLLDFENVNGKYHFVMKNGGICPLCGNAHHGNTNEAVYPCVGFVAHKYFALTMESSGVIIRDI